MSKMRLGWYAGVSTALAGSVVLSAFHQRPNFYSAMVYLSQSNFCLLALINFTFLLYSTFLYGLTRLCFGPLRAVEVEQLTERAWFAITETCLAMTIFREEIGAWFLVMFTALVTGKVWGWIGDGRVEILEQQPPANPRLFHTRLTVSLVTSLLYDIWLLRYATSTVIQQARPNMMVMFLFEFAVLATCSCRTAIRYVLSLAEQQIVKTQTRKRLAERRQEVRQQRENALREREQATARGEEPSDEELPNPDDVDEMDIEVSGWAAKGEWVLWLDLIIDFIKLAIYVAFFLMLLMFHGLPIHIIRDVFVTSRDFLKRLNALLRYRRAIQEMNQYPDATEEELARENTCIICREEMRPWDATGNPATVDRVRPKKLPCGHTLHLGCLKSWLERQQVCPTCRRPVATERPNNGGNRRAGLRIQIGGGAPAPAAPGANIADARGPNAQNQAQNGQEQPPPQGQQPQQQQQPEQRPRVFNLGPLRLGFAANGQQVRELARQFGMPNQGGDNNQNNNNVAATPAVATPAAAATPQGVQTGDNLTNAATHLQQAEQAFQRELQGLQNRQQEIHTSQLLLAELQRLRQRQPQADPTTADAPLWTSGPTQVPANPSTWLQPPPFPHMPGMSGFPSLPARISSPLLGRHGASGYTTSIPSGSLDLPDGVVIPPGWSLMPLQRLDGSNLPTNGVVQPGSVPANGDATSSDGAGNSNDGPSNRNTRPADLPNNISNILRPTTPLRPEDRPELGPGVLHYPLLPRAPHVRPAEPPAVVSPSPMVPNWGDSAQLFRNNARLDQQDVASQGQTQRQDHSPARSDSSNIPLDPSRGAEVLGRLQDTNVPAPAPPAPSAPASAERGKEGEEDEEDEDEDDDEDEEEEDGNERSDGERNTQKARAATVADASSDEDED